MKIVISNPTEIEDEAVRINELFAAGLEVFHLRKPLYSKDEVIRLLEGIHVKYFDRITLHQFHELNEAFGLSRLHFTSQKRQEAGTGKLQALSDQGLLLSTSVHTNLELLQLPQCFDYVLLGPVFPSISKPGYLPDPLGLDLENLPETHFKKIAIGGIKPSNSARIKAFGFDGIALLGSIWNYNRQQGLHNFEFS